MELFRAQGAGHLVLISSVASIRGMPGTRTAYGASKAALNALAEGIRSDVYGSQITVSTILPGYIATDINVGRRGPFTVGLDKGVDGAGRRRSSASRRAATCPSGRGARSPGCSASCRCRSSAASPAPEARRRRRPHGGRRRRGRRRAGPPRSAARTASSSSRWVPTNAASTTAPCPGTTGPRARACSRPRVAGHSAGPGVLERRRGALLDQVAGEDHRRVAGGLHLDHQVVVGVPAAEEAQHHLAAADVEDGDVVDQVVGRVERRRPHQVGRRRSPAARSSATTAARCSLPGRRQGRGAAARAPDRRRPERGVAEAVVVVGVGVDHRPRMRGHRADGGDQVGRLAEVRAGVDDEAGAVAEDQPAVEVQLARAGGRGRRRPTSCQPALTSRSASAGRGGRSRRRRRTRRARRPAAAPTRPRRRRRARRPPAPRPVPAASASSTSIAGWSARIRWASPRALALGSSTRPSSARNASSGCTSTHAVGRRRRPARRRAPGWPGPGSRPAPTAPCPRPRRDAAQASA